MGRLFILILTSPWWAFFPLAGGVVWFGEHVYQQALEPEAEKAAALAAGPPAVVDLADFHVATDRRSGDEVNVRGWIDIDSPYELVESPTGSPTATRYMMTMFGADDPKGEPVVRAAIMMNEKQKDIFFDRVDDWVVDFNDQGFIFEINGFGKTTASVSTLAYDAMKERGLRKNGTNFIFLEPFFDGREAALAPQGMPQKKRMAIWLVALGVALLGVAKKVLLERSPQEETASQDAAEAYAESPAASCVPLAAGITPDTPLGRLAARRAAPEVEETPWAPEPFEPTDTRADESEGADPPETVDPMPDFDTETPAAQSLANVVFFARLALAMLFVAALFYEPLLALALLAILVPVFGLMKLIGAGLALLSRRRVGEAI